MTLHQPECVRDHSVLDSRNGTRVSTACVAAVPDATHIIRHREHRRLDPSLRGWIVNTAGKNHWRVARMYDLEDLIQEGFVVYAKCRNKYVDVKNQRHFMALVKTAYLNRICTLSKMINRRSPDVRSVSDLVTQHRDSVHDILDQLAAPQPEEQTFAVLMAGMPAELRQLVQVLLSDARNIGYRRNGRVRETRNQYLCRLIGADPEKTNLEKSFYEYMGVET